MPRPQGAQVDLLPGAVLRPVLRHHAGQEVLPLRRAGRRADRAAVRGAREGARHRHGAPDLRGGADRRVLQHGRAWSMPTARSSASTASTTSRTSTEVLGEVLLPPGQPGYPVFDTAVGKIGMYICYDRHFPEGWRELGLNGAHIVFNPNATKPGLSNRLWEVEQPAAAVANGYFVLAAEPRRARGQRVRRRGGELLRHEPGDRPARQLRRRARLGRARGAAGPRPRHRPWSRQMRDDWQFYRDRRPDSYTARSRRRERRTDQP